MSNITIQCIDCISTVTIDSPPENYLSREVLSKLNKAVSEMLLPEADLRVVLLTARGKNFSAGIDYASFVNMTKAEAAHFAEVGYHLLKQIENLPVPVVAALKGETTGAGIGLALAADISVVASDALDKEAERLAVRIGGNSLSALRSAKMLINFGLNEGYDVGLKQEVTAFGEAFNPDTKQWERL